MKDEVGDDAMNVNDYETAMATDEKAMGQINALKKFHGGGRWSLENVNALPRLP